VNNLKIYKTLNILCVDDEEPIRKIYNDMFSFLFKNVYIASNGKEGYEIFSNNDIDIILTDHMMPIMDGLKMSQEIRKKDISIPIIMITALENIDMLRGAIDAHITSFIKKPLSSKRMFSTLEMVAKSIIAERLLMKEQSQKLSYSNYQEKLTYKKEQKIIRNDIENDKEVLNFQCDVVFKPRDILSGDSYSVRKISQDKRLFFIVDGMGKGVSASATAMLCCAYLNHIIDRNIDKKNFTLEHIVKKLYEFIAPNLLEEEVLSATLLLFDKEKIEYAMFSMPAVLYMKKNSDEVFEIKSNNPPMTSYTTNINISQISSKDITKMLIFSDGLSENRVKDNKSIYGHALIGDFRDSNTTKELEAKRSKAISIQEDDITYIFCRTKEH